MTRRLLITGADRVTCDHHHESPDDCEAAGAQLILGRRDR